MGTDLHGWEEKIGGVPDTRIAIKYSRKHSRFPKLFPLKLRSFV
jgi:hypothetical protein